MLQNMKSIFAIFLALPIPAISAEWQQVASSSDSIMRIDAASIVSSKGGARKAWKDFSFTEGAPFLKAGTRSLELTLFDCKARTVAIVQQVEYDQSGKVTSSTSVPLSKVQFTDVVPESFDDAALEFVCKHRIKKTS